MTDSGRQSFVPGVLSGAPRRSGGAGREASHRQRRWTDGELNGKPLEEIGPHVKSRDRVRSTRSPSLTRLNYPREILWRCALSDGISVLDFSHAPRPLLQLCSWPSMGRRFTDRIPEGEDRVELGPPFTGEDSSFF